MGSQRKNKILAVDDTPLNLALLSRSLQAEFEVSLCESGSAALAWLAEQSADIILLDIMMPGMDGFATFEQIRKLPSAAHTPIVFLTASEDHSSEMRGLALGAADFIFKPIRVELVSLRIRNILRMARMKRELKTSEERLRHVMEATGDGIWDWDLRNDSVIHNQAWCHILGLDDDCIEHPLEFFTKLIHPGDFGKVQKALYESLHGSSSYRSEHRLLHQNGSHIWVEDRGQVVERAPDGQPLRMVGCIKNIDQRRQYEERIHHLAFYDALTELPNRRLFLDRLQQAIYKAQRNGQQGALMFIDMDRFKELNDTHGHACGDALLIEVGRRLQTAVRRQDSVARLGGDEFVVLLEGLAGDYADALARARRVAEKVLATLNRPYRLGTIDYPSTPSIGLTVFDGSSASLDSVLSQADRAMYAAKSAGRNTLRVAAQEQNPG